MRKVTDVLTRMLESLISVCLLIMLVVVFVLVVRRYVFNKGIVGANEFVTILFVYTSAIGGALAVGTDDHVRISYLIEKLSPGVRRWVDSLNLALVGLLNGCMLWYSFRWIAMTGDYVMRSTQLPRSVAQWSLAIGCGLAVFYCVVRLVDIWRRA